MSLWTRIKNVVRGEQLSAEIDEELHSHLDEAVLSGRDRQEAQQALGSPLRLREQSRDVRLITCLDSLRADLIFGWRQLQKRKVSSAAAILSLGLGIGACTGAFRLIDALLFRPLPVANADRLYALTRQGRAPDGRWLSGDVWAYPAFQLMREAVKGQAELIAVSKSERTDLTYKSDQEMEKANLQFVSGWIFDRFGLSPAEGRLFTEKDDLRPAAHPYAVISHDYWARRFASDPSAVGRSFRMGNRAFEIVGVAPEAFTGTETGIMTDIFVPTMMHPGVTRNDWTWFSSLASLEAGSAVGPLQARLHATFQAFETERAKGFTGMSKEAIAKFLEPVLVLESAASGVSALQRESRQALLILGLLAFLVLLIACANVANLMTAQAASRMREMALRVSIGAGRWRLLQLVLVECAMLATLAAALGAAFASWAAPFVVSQLNIGGNPTRLALPMDWRVLSFSVVVTLLVTVLFGLSPALRASGVQPVTALKGGADPHAKRRLMHALIAVQVAFCFVVLFAAGLFTATFDRLSHRSLGFSSEGVLTLDTIAQQPVSPVLWEQMAEHMRSMPGIESASLARQPLLAVKGWNGFVSVEGGPPGPELAFFLGVAPRWIETMKISLVAGRDLRPADTTPGQALVNETFVKQYFNGANPVGRHFKKGSDLAFEVVGVVKDAPYRDIHEPILPVAYVPLNGPGNLLDATFVLRTASANPLVLASTLRNEIPRIRPELRVSNIRTQLDILQGQTVRERLLAMLAFFFAIVALLLASIGLYGVLDYSMLQRRREIGIRMAIGAGPAGIAGLVTKDVFAMVLLGAVTGLGIGLVGVRSLESLLYEVKGTDLGMLAIPAIAIVAAVALAALPAVIHALRIDLVRMLRTE
ncbi:ADOP family duplicated permease [Bryobacter aggregatus]|uniref:ADOP family duplicated permease n=1 Tax=Bryobacter aggregatus TaxID=360054 RepID=UPI0004E1CF58|nr:ADOP family duplicated permease [Bryobacter aggregatus]